MDARHPTWRPRGPRRWALITVLALVVVALVTLALISSGGGGDSRGGAASPAARTQAGLCAAIGAAADDVSAARAVFFDRSHDGLHDLADRVTEVDAIVAARLLQAKQRVEVMLDAATTGAELTVALAGLADATAAAAEVVGDPGVGGCD